MREKVNEQHLKIKADGRHINRIQRYQTTDIIYKRTLDFVTLDTLRDQINNES